MRISLASSPRARGEHAVYIGHPSWKAIGARIGYSAATGAMVLVLSWFGILALLMALIPVVAISPICSTSAC